MTSKATLIIDPRRTIGRIDPRIYGQFIEHIGRVVYGGVFDHGSRLSDGDGYRLDVLDAIRTLAPTVLRWPGGNFASGYHWRDGIGDPEQRPARHDLAWDALETNRFGTEEFLELCRRLGAEPYLNLNASTGTFDEAQEWLQYCNATHPLPEVQQRRAGPHPDPHDVRLWGIGNENYGWWQHGHTSAERYAETAREWGKLLHWADERAELIGVGAPSPDWNWTVLTEAGRSIDFLSLHFYWHGAAEDRYHAMLAGPLISERIVEGSWGMALEAQRALQLARPTPICVDEWGVWERTYQPFMSAATNLETLMRKGITSKAGFDNRFEETYDLKDALTVATWFHVMWRHPEKIRLATMAQLVNAVAPIMATPAGILRQTIFHPVAIARAHAGSVAVDVRVECSDGVAAPGHPDGSVPALDAAATIDPATGRVHVSLVNRLESDEIALTIEGMAGDATSLRLHHEDPFAENTFDSPHTVTPREGILDLGSEIILPPHSHTTLVRKLVG